MEQKETALREKEELQRKIDDLQQELELLQVKDHKEVSGQCDYSHYTIPQSGMCVCLTCIVYLHMYMWCMCIVVQCTSISCFLFSIHVFYLL